MKVDGSVTTGTEGEVMVLDDRRVGVRDPRMNEQLFRASVAEMRVVRDRKVLDNDVVRGIGYGILAGYLASVVFGYNSVDSWAGGIGLTDIAPAVAEFHQRVMEMVERGRSWEMNRVCAVGVNCPAGAIVGGVAGGVVKAVKSALDKRRFSKTPAVVE